LKTRKIIIVAVSFIAACAVGMIVYSGLTAQPTYEGRSLSSWLDEAGTWDDNGPAPVSLAFRTMGTNALPFLVEHALSPRSPWRDRLQYAFQWLGWTKLRGFVDKRYRRQMAAFAVLEHLGSDATNALPFIFSAMRADLQRNTYWADALMAVMDADPSVIPAVIREVREPRHRRSLCVVLGIARVNPEVSVPFLKTQLEDEDRSVEEAARRALALFGADEGSASELARPETKETDPNPNAEQGTGDTNGFPESGRRED